MSDRRRFRKPRPNHPLGRNRRIKQFSDEIAGRLLLTNCVSADEDLSGHPRCKLLRGAIEFYRAGCNGNDESKACIVCHIGFGETQPAAFLISIPVVPNATNAAVSAICPSCWRTQSPESFDRAATRVLRRVLPRGRFLDPAVRP